jgi:hypothetical protein
MSCRKGGRCPVHLTPGGGGSGSSFPHTIGTLRLDSYGLSRNMCGSSLGVIIHWKVDVRLYSY